MHPDYRMTADDVLVKPPATLLPTHLQPFEPKQASVAATPQQKAEPLLADDAPSEQCELWLVPNRLGNDSRPFQLSPGEWRLARQLAARGGYFDVNEAGLDRDCVNYFMRSLRTAAARGYVAEQHAAFVRGLLAFLAADGAYGFGVERRWQRVVPRRDVAGRE